ncbi:NB-ARC domain containing protein [Trema orientale]|uniref:NB-ARC domain containing protein n=1 Tax=Trema orientale TaxID=63057 RepID=A0A2P5EME0_TREOI|nr:NB-ARC domain containing protein [Trema orientale]
MEELISTLGVSLGSKRYKVVFDDVWHGDFWEVMLHALPHADKGSKVIVITRNDIIDASCRESPNDFVYELEPLSEVMSWDLFRRKASQHGSEFCCTPELEQLSFEFIRICEGFALAIVAMDGLLSTKVNLSKWMNLSDCLRMLMKS